MRVAGVDVGQVLTRSRHVVWATPEPRMRTRPVRSLRPAVASYDPRHTEISPWLNSGVTATEVARRAGHGDAVLLKIYACCIDGQADAANQRITDALAAQDTQFEPGDEKDRDGAQAS